MDGASCDYSESVIAKNGTTRLSIHGSKTANLITSTHFLHWRSTLWAIFCLLLEVRNSLKIFSAALFISCFDVDHIMHNSLDAVNLLFS